MALLEIQFPRGESHELYGLDLALYSTLQRLFPIEFIFTLDEEPETDNGGVRRVNSMHRLMGKVL